MVKNTVFDVKQVSVIIRDPPPDMFCCDYKKQLNLYSTVLYASLIFSPKLSNCSFKLIKLSLIAPYVLELPNKGCN